MKPALCGETRSWENSLKCQLVQVSWNLQESVRSRLVEQLLLIFALHLKDHLSEGAVCGENGSCNEILSDGAISGSNSGKYCNTAVPMVLTVLFTATSHSWLRLLMAMLSLVWAPARYVAASC
jgi:hypothetical protein